MCRHNALVNDCGILHRDISLGNILAVSTGSDRKELRGLLINLDSAIRTDGVERTTRAERSGTLPYMRIANLENLDTDCTALDDWESLLYVVCWVATFGVNSGDRRNPSDKTTINSWNVDEKQAAEAKRGHVHSSNSFEGDVIRDFLPGYKLKFLQKDFIRCCFCILGVKVHFLILQWILWCPESGASHVASNPSNYSLANGNVNCMLNAPN